VTPADRITRLLTETNMNVTEIASALGFETCDKLARYFRKARGISPLEYRRKYGRA
jgi:transcriptional regulator GlxA family with amidase domain